MPVPPNRFEPRLACDQQSTGPCLVIGGSTRAAAGSIRRAGATPWCIDLFGDADLFALSPWVRRVPQLSAQHVVPLLRELPSTPWMYTGGLENQPLLIEQIARHHPLLGNGPDVLAKVRDPWWIDDCLTEAQLPVLPLLPRDAPPPRGKRQLVIKSLRGTGGMGISYWDPASPAARKRLELPHYFQQYVRGPVISALYLARPSGVELIGTSEQLSGLRELKASPFVYCGNIAPAPLPGRVIQMIERMGTALHRAAQLTGLFGCDFVVARGVPWLLEVNPRYTAATELWEWLTNRAFLREWGLLSRGSIALAEPVAHASDSIALAEPVAHTSRQVAHASAAPGTTSYHGMNARQPARFCGKATVYATRNGQVTDLSHWLIPTAAAWPRLADVPHPGTLFQRGEPVCTVFADASTAKACRMRLLARARRVRDAVERPGRTGATPDTGQDVPPDPALTHL